MLSLKFKKQMWEAAGWTFLQTFMATIAPSIAVVESGNWNDLLAPLASAGMAGLAAAFSLIKSAVVRNLGEQDSVFISGGETLPEEGEVG